MLKLKCPWTGKIYDARFYLDNYVEGTTPEGGKRLYVAIHVMDIYGFEPYCDVTVNIPHEDLTDEACGFIDTNNAPFLEDWLEKNELAEPTGNFAVSGYCVYPEYRFDLAKLRA